MRVNGEDYDVNELVGQLDFESNSFKNVSSKLMLTQSEIAVLTKNHIDYQNANSLRDLMIKIEAIVEDEDLDPDDEDELDDVLKSIGERNYYENTVK